jgi:type I restriction enzyme R subunit
MEEINQKEKTMVFCATQDHALAVRDLINQMSMPRPSSPERNAP